MQQKQQCTYFPLVLFLLRQCSCSERVSYFRSCKNLRNFLCVLWSRIYTERGQQALLNMTAVSSVGTRAHTWSLMSLPTPGASPITQEPISAPRAIIPPAVRPTRLQTCYSPVLSSHELYQVRPGPFASNIPYPNPHRQGGARCPGQGLPLCLLCSGQELLPPSPCTMVLQEDGWDPGSHEQRASNERSISQSFRRFNNL